MVALRNLPGIVQLLWNGTPTKNCDNRFLLKLMKVTLKIEILINLGKLWFGVDLPTFSKFGKIDPVHGPCQNFIVPILTRPTWVLVLQT